MNYYYLKGFLYENLIINDFTKRKFNRGKNRHPSYWQTRIFR